LFPGSESTTPDCCLSPLEGLNLGTGVSVQDVGVEGCGRGGEWKRLNRNPTSSQVNVIIPMSMQPHSSQFSLVHIKYYLSSTCNSADSFYSVHIWSGRSQGSRVDTNHMSMKTLPICINHRQIHRTHPLPRYEPVITHQCHQK